MISREWCQSGQRAVLYISSKAMQWRMIATAFWRCLIQIVTAMLSWQPTQSCDVLYIHLPNVNACQQQAAQRGAHKSMHTEFC